MTTINKRRWWVAISTVLIAAVVVGFIISGDDDRDAGARLAILNRREENGRRLITFELSIPRGKQVYVVGSELVKDWGTPTANDGPPEWAAPGNDPSGKYYQPNTKTTFSIVEPTQPGRRLRLHIWENRVGLQAWRGRLRDLFRTKNFSALRQPPPGHCIHSEPITDASSNSTNWPAYVIPL